MAAALILSGCAVYRFSSPDHPSKVAAGTLDAASGVAKEAAPGMRFHVAKVRGAVFGGNAGRLSITAQELNDCLSAHWPSLFSKSSEESAGIPLTVELGGSLPFYGLGAPPGDIGAEIGLMLLLGVMRMENDGSVSARLLVGNAEWAEKAHAAARYNSAVCCQPLLFPIAYPIVRVVPPRESDWPSDTHFGSLGYVNAERTQQIAVDLASVAILRAVAALKPPQIASIRNRALLTGKQVAAEKRLQEGAETYSAVADDGGAVTFAQTSHEFRPDSSPAARGIPDVVEQRYDERTRRGIVRADLTGCDAEAAYAHLTRRLIPAICETKNVVLDTSSPPPAHARFRTLGERKEADSGILAIEFEAIE